MEIDKERSFIHFVYPFLFRAESFEARVEAIEGAQWEGQKQALTVWEKHRFPEDDLLPHVARYLNPPDDSPATAQSWQLSDAALRSPRGLGGGADWRLTTPQGEVAFRVEAVRLMLFRVGVGLLIVRAEPTGNSDAQWLDFLHYFRFIRGQRQVGVKLERRVGIDPQTRQPLFSPFFPEPAGGVDQYPDGSGVFGAIVDALLNTGTIEGESKAWWGEVFVPGQMLPFAALFFKGVPEQEIAPLLYRVRNFFHARQEIHPAPDDLRLDHPALLPYTERLWFLFSLDGGAFVGCDAPDTPFFRETLPDHLRNHYFLLFLLALHQRFAMMMLSEEVAKHWVVGDISGDDRREAAFRRIRDALLSFTARGLFVQVMQREHHHRCYRKWQETFQVEQLYQEVSTEVREMHDYLQMQQTERIQQLAEEQRRQMEAKAQAEAEREQAAQKRTQRLEKRISLFGVPLAAVGLTIGFLGINLRDITSGPEGLTIWRALFISIGAGTLLGLVVLLVLWMFGRGGRGK